MGGILKYIWGIQTRSLSCLLRAAVSVVQSRGAGGEAGSVVRLSVVLVCLSQAAAGPKHGSRADLWTDGSLLRILSSKAAEEIWRGDPRAFALADECFVRGSCQILMWCWCCFRRKVQVASHTWYCDSLPGNKDGNGWISHGNKSTQVLIQKSKKEGKGLFVVL